MTTNQLDTSTALVAVDLQHATINVPSALDMPCVVANAARLAAAFRQRGRLVVLTETDLNNPPPGDTAVSDRPRPNVPAAALNLAPELDLSADDIVLTKRGWSAFAGTGLDGLLRDRNITHVLLVGLATNYGIESTARQAYDLGYNVVIAIDAINNPQIEGHEHALSRVLPALSRLSTTDKLIEQVLGGP
ncbi:cysteine hydrolase family protein [Allobranchiibius sp. CTAmp26]|uniref:cysteine hydrolase family protein n=1 Tax=Allobranchiibius sp. CTAmp26 TaxID=2815214 RepID=UPI001AA1C061|nr:isochorismatase family cysteine hydrolase [Allobranchiibius sp. CTAmp26]MBO1756955.1 cysteine hydrolase [Allobranchiibius sp. CTAmp26]